VRARAHTQGWPACAASREPGRVKAARHQGAEAVSRRAQEVCLPGERAAAANTTHALPPKDLSLSSPRSTWNSAPRRPSAVSLSLSPATLTCQCPPYTRPSCPARPWRRAVEEKERERREVERSRGRQSEVVAAVPPRSCPPLSRPSPRPLLLHPVDFRTLGVSTRPSRPASSPRPSMRVRTQAHRGARAGSTGGGGGGCAAAASSAGVVIVWQAKFTELSHTPRTRRWLPGGRGAGTGSGRRRVIQACAGLRGGGEARRARSSSPVA